MEIYAIGNLTADLILSKLKDFPEWGTEIFIDKISLRCGGNLGNLIFPLNKMHLNPLIFGNLGDDYYGKYMLKILQESGFSTDHIRIEKETPTSISVSLVKDDGERALLTYFGQLAYVDHNFLYDCLNLIKKNSIVILCSIFQFPNLKLNEVEEIFKNLIEKNCIVLLDTGWDPKNWEKETIQDLHKLLKYVTYFLPNLSEAKKISGIENEKEILKFFSMLGTENVIIKKGPKGSTALINNKLIKSQTYPLPCSDATGAGDAFNASIIYCLKNNYEPDRMLDFANAASSIFVSRFENKFPELNEIYNLINQMNINQTEKLKFE